VEEIHLTRRGNLAGVAQFLRELPILDLELFERLEFADIEVSRWRGQGRGSNEVPHFTSEIEATARRRRAPEAQVMGKRKFQRPAIFAGLGGQTNVWRREKRQRRDSFPTHFRDINRTTGLKRAFSADSLCDQRPGAMPQA
jgi:hypothetical protein